MGFFSFPIIFVIHGFSWKVIFNLQFITGPGAVVQNLLAASIGGGFGYLIYLKYYQGEVIEDLPSWFDMSHIIVIIVNRAAVIAIKYAFYSEDHHYLKKNVKFDREFLTKDLIVTTLA